MNKIKRISKFFRWLLIIAFLALPAYLIFYWLQLSQDIIMHSDKNPFNFNFIPYIPNLSILKPLTIETKLLGFTISLLPTAINLAIIYLLIELFHLYEQSKIFTFKNVNIIKKIGYLLLANQLINPIYQVFISAALTWHNPPGHRIAQITLGSTNIGIILIALLIILISWIMAEGCKLRQDQLYTI